MRFYFFLAILVVAAIIGQMSRAEISPCAAEEADLTRTDGQLAESMTLRLSLKSQVETEMVTRAERLTPLLKEATDRMDRAGQAALMDQRLFARIDAAKVTIDSLLNDRSALEKLDALITLQLAQPPVRPFSKCVQEAADSAKHDGLNSLIDLLRRLEGHRLWIEQLTAWRSELAADSRVLSQALQYLSTFADGLRQRIVVSSAHLTEFKLKIREAERQIEQSLAHENRLKSQLDQVERRITLLKNALPDLRTRLNRCTHRAQFGTI